MNEFNESYLKVINEDVSKKDEFLSIAYDLIDLVFQLGKNPETNEQNPVENKEVNEILRSLESVFDDRGSEFN